MDDTIFAHGVGSQLMLQETMNQGSSHAMIESASKRLLQNEDEVKAVMRHVNHVSLLIYLIIGILNVGSKF